MRSTASLPERPVHSSCPAPQALTLAAARATARLLARAQATSTVLAPGPEVEPFVTLECMGEFALASVMLAHTHDSKTGVYSIRVRSCAQRD